jgi:pyrimidine-nucleoside phosphorylase
MKEKIIEKFNLGKTLTYDELSYFFNGYLSNDVSDEEMTIVLKNICKNGLSEQEIFDLVDIFIKSGDTLHFDFPTIDKHSTGGVGDKTTLVVLSILASCGVKIVKMSGRALGYTGGTIDKLESIGVNVNLTYEEVLKQVNNIGMVITSQTKNLCPMDKKIYALRDVTGTTNSLALIAISIMSKKIAGGSDNILIDVKVGRGALVRTAKEAKLLANLMISIGKKYNKKVVCMLTRMDNPLGNNIGNSIEILEVLDVLKNKVRNNLYYLSYDMASVMLSIYTGMKIRDARAKVKEAITSGKAYNKFVEFVNYQGGKLEIRLERPIEIYAKESGFIKSIDAKELGSLSMELGAGRSLTNKNIDYNAGIILEKNVCDFVSRGETLCMLYGKNSVDIDRAFKAFKIQKNRPFMKSIIIKIIK